MDRSSNADNLLDPKTYRFDPIEYSNRQKEIDDIFCSAFDDITSIQLSDDENNNNNNEKNTDDGDGGGKFYADFEKRHHFDGKSNNNNGGKLFSTLTSTPINHQRKNGGIPPIKDRHRFSDIIEEDTIVDVDSLENDEQQRHDDNGSHSDLSLSTDFNEDLASSGHRTSSLLDNDIPFKDLCFLKEQCAKMNANYEMLQNRIQHQDECTTVNVLQAKIKLLEAKLRDETEAKEWQKQKCLTLESRIQSLECQRFQKSDAISRDQCEQMKIFETLKSKHQKEIQQLRGDFEAQIKTLTTRLEAKDDELISSCNLVLKYKQEMNYYQKKVQTLENDNQTSREQIEATLWKSFDEAVQKLKTEWEAKLQEDIDRVVRWFEDWTNDGDDQDDATEQQLDVRFERLIRMCTALKRSTAKREEQIQAQIDRMADAKRQLERALLEVRLRNSSISSTTSSPSHSRNEDQHLSPRRKSDTETQQPVDMMQTMLRSKYEQKLNDLRQQFDDELARLRYQLRNQEEETNHWRRKTNKYKEHYRAVVERHKQELSLLKSEFTKVMQDLMKSGYGTGGDIASGQIRPNSCSTPLL